MFYTIYLLNYVVKDQSIYRLEMVELYVWLMLLTGLVPIQTFKKAE